jgi:hypothetical protein
VVDVLLDRPLVRAHPADGRADRGVPGAAQELLDLRLDRVVELVPAASEELDAVVGHRVVRGADDHAEVGVEGVGQVGDARRRDHPEAEHVDPGRGQPGHDRVLEDLSRDPRVATDHGQGSLARPVEVAAVDDDARRGDRQVEGELGRDLAVGEATDPVGAEDARHPGLSRACDQRLLY